MKKPKDNKDNELLGTNAQGVVNDTPWESQDIASKSEVHLEDDPGTGGAAVIRQFVFAANPEAFRQHTPTKQELFNYHAKAIEGILWADGLTILPDVDPKITINKKQTRYRIFVGAKPQRGHTLSERPQTLAEITRK